MKPPKGCNGTHHRVDLYFPSDEGGTVIMYTVCDTCKTISYQRNEGDRCGRLADQDIMDTCEEFKRSRAYEVTGKWDK